MRKFTKLTSALMILLFATSTVFSQNANSVYNQLMDEYLQNGEKAMVVNLMEQSKAKNYKKVAVDLGGKGEAYAFVAYDPSAVLPVGPAAFDTDDPNAFTSLGTNTAADFMAAGTWAEGIWYAEEYGTGNLYTIDPGDGTMTLVGSGGVGMNGMAYDGSTMYGCSSTDLYSIDLSTGAATLIGAMGNPGAVMIALACDGSTLYGFDLGDDNLYDIDMSSGAASIIGSLEIDISYAQDAEYDKDNGVLYLAAYTGAGELYTTDPSSGACTLVGPMAGGAEICGFAIPYTGVTFPNDVGIMSITEPASGGDLSNAESVTVKIKNYGDNPQSNFDVYFTMDGGAQNVETISATIEPGDFLLHTFATTVDLSAYGFYDFMACTMLANDDNTDNDCKNKSVENFAPSYCEADAATEDEYIVSVVVGTIDDGPFGADGLTYHDYTATSTDMMVDNDYDMTVVNGTPYTGDQCTVWVDWNQDLDFEDGGEMFTLVGPDAITYTGMITPPMTAMMGSTRMRIRLNYTAAAEPCGTATYGEVLDYSVNVGGGSNPDDCEDFDELTVDGFVAEQLGGLWTTWSGTPGSAEDAIVSDMYSVSPDNSFLSEGSTDLVWLFSEENLTSGSYTFTHEIYIPTGKTGYWNLQKDVTPGVPEGWGFQIQYEDDDMIHIDAGAEDAVVASYMYDTWYHNEIMVDLDNDWCEFYIDGELIIGYQWTLGTFGTPGALTLGSTNIWASAGAGGALPGAHFDDLCFVNNTPTGVQEVLEQEISVYPNPATDRVNVKSDFDITKVSVYNYAGQLIMIEEVDSKFYQLNTSEFNSGLYFLQINTSEGSVSKRIVIQ